MSVGLASPGLVSPGLSPDETSVGGGSVFNPVSGRGGGAAQPITVIDMHLGDFDASAVIYGKFTTFRPSTGAAYTLGGTPALSVYKDNSTTQSATGVTLTADFDSVTGLNHFAIDTSADGTFYAAGSFFDIVITTGTVDSVSVVGSVVGRFTLRKNSALKPATAGRTLVVDAAGLADANTVKLGPSGSGTAQTARDIGASVLLSNGTGTGQLKLAGGYVAMTWADIGAPTTAVNLSGTTISTSQAVASVSGNVGGNVVGSIGSVATGGITTGSFAAGAIDAAAIATDAIGALEMSAAAAAEVASAVRTELAAELARIDVATSTRLASASYTAPPSAATVAGAVWDEAIAGHLTAGTTGEKLNAAASAGDPWSTALPGAYSAGSAGFLVGTYLDAAISTRLATSGYTAPLSASGTRSALGLASANLDTQLDAIPTAVENADALLNRDMSAVSDTNSRSPLNALRHIRNKWSISGTTLTVTKEDDSTSAWTSTLSTNAGADPITGSDPA